MKLERTKNATRAIFINVIFQIVSILVPFFMRSLILYYLGKEYLGLGGLFRSILSILNLAELGVGSTLIYCMYKPIADDDSETICALMKLFRTVYRIIGLVVLCIGLSLTPFLPYLIKENVTADVNLYVLYFLNLGCTVLTYWMFAYKNCLLVAYQRGDIRGKIYLGVRCSEYVLKILSLVLFRNYYYYLIIQILCQIAINILLARKVDKIFPNYQPQGQLPKDMLISIARRVRDLFTSKLSAAINNTADTLVISSFLGLTTLAVYQNYYYIISALLKMVVVVIDACMAGIGNSLVVESPEKNYLVLKKMTVLFGWVMSVSSSMLLCLYQPFMIIWMGKENLLQFSLVICFVVYFYSIGMNKLINMFKDAAGIWTVDKWRPLTAALVNVILNLSTINRLGLYGVLLSTIISIVVVQIPWLIHNLFYHVFPHEHIGEYIGYYCGFWIVALTACFLSWMSCSVLVLSEWPSFFINGIISFLIPNIIFFMIYGRDKLFKETLNQIIRVVVKKTI